jgi:hypothetical protein
MSGSMSTANSFPSGIRLAMRTLKYPVPRAEVGDTCGWLKMQRVQNLIRLLRAAAA